MSEQITVVGTIVNDPERRRTAAGHTVVNFRLASNVRRRDETSGTWVDGHTNWYSVSAYRGLAEHALESLRRGQRVIVAGAFKLREWEANGRQGVSAEIDASSLGHDLLWGTTEYRRDERGQSGAASPSATPAITPGDTATDQSWSDPSALDRPAPTVDGAPGPDLSSSWAPTLVEQAAPF